MSGIYDLKLTMKETGIDKFVELYQHQEKYLAYCRECHNYGTKWSCPPLNVNTADFLRPYRYVTVAAVQMVFRKGIVESVPPDKIKEVTIDTILPVKNVFHDAMLSAEQEIPDSITLSSGGCTLCDKCLRPEAKPCRQPARMRYSLDSFGFDLSAITEELLGIKLLWCKGNLPDYYTLVHALFTYEPDEGRIERVLRKALMD